MAFLVGENFKLIYNVLKSEVESTDITNPKRLEMHDILNTLNASERCLLAKYFCKMSWNIGSLKVLNILQELRILTATEYILSYENYEEVQLILNDFLELRFELIGNLLINAALDSCNSLRLNALLEDCFENLFKDLLLKPDLNDLSFLDYIKKSVPADIQLKIIQKLLSSILTLHQTNVKDVYYNFTSWINEGVDDLKFPQDFYKKILHEHIEGSLNYLLKCSISDNFKEWKFYLIILQTISRNNYEMAGPYIRKYLKLRLKQSAAVPCKRNIMHMLLTARAATATTMNITKNLSNYAEWYKSYIGEMKFFLTGDEFQNILSILDQCINYEMEVDYLEIHTIVVISPPIHCGNLVKNYISKCKQRLQQIKKGHFQVDDPLNESIVIDDSN